MDIGHIDGATRVLGVAQGYRGLPLRDELQNCSVSGEGTPVMVTEWVPSTEDRYAIFGGSNILLHVVGTAHPPVRIEVDTLPTVATQQTVARDAFMNALRILHSMEPDWLPAVFTRDPVNYLMRADDATVDRIWDAVQARQPARYRQA